MRVIVALAGLGAVVLPILYALLMVGVWAIVRNRGIRSALLAGMMLFAMVVPARIGFGYWLSNRNADRFASYCEQYTAPAETGKVSSVGSIRANFDPENREQKLAVSIGDVVFPYYLATRLLLTGERPYSSVASLTTDGHQLTSIGADGHQEQKDRRAGPAVARYGFEWRDNGYSIDDAVGSADLVLMDYQTGTQLAVQPAFILFTPRLTAVPGFAATPFVVGEHSMKRCPDPAALARFVKSVLQPGPVSWP